MAVIDFDELSAKVPKEIDYRYLNKIVYSAK